MSFPFASACSFVALLTFVAATGCDADTQEESIEEIDSDSQAAKVAMDCGGPGMRVVDDSVFGSDFPPNVVDGGTQIIQQWLSATPGYTPIEYATQEEADTETKKVCDAFLKAEAPAIETRVGARAKAACEGKLFSTFVCEICDNGAGDKCQKEIREGSCEWRTGVAPSATVSPHVRTIAPPVVHEPGRQIVPPDGLASSDVPVPGTKYRGDCLITAAAAAQIKDNKVGCGEANSCD